MSGRRTGRPLRREAGSALVVALLVTAVVTLLGIGYLFLAETEERIAAHQRDRARLLALAEGGARMVKRWFDAPVRGSAAAPENPFLGRFDLRLKRFFEVGERRIDLDGDPATPTLDPGQAGWLHYRQGLLAPD